MHISDAAFGIHDAIHGHASQFEKIHFLAVRPRNTMIWIGQADKGQVFFSPIFLESVHVVGTDSQDLRVP